VTDQRLVLASASPRRLALLAQIGVTPERIVPTEINESPFPRELPRSYALRVAREKAAAAAAPGCFVLAADTVTCAGRRILPKAETEAEALACLRLLCGRRHRVFTAVVLRAPNGRQAERLVESTVTLGRLSPEQLGAYLSSGEWKGKAGGYAIQGQAASFVRFLSGSYSNVVGLPLFETAQLLRGAGWQIP
jgi:septum formation protein